MSSVASDILEALMRRYPQAVVGAQPDGRFTVNASDGSVVIYRAITPTSSEQGERIARIIRSGILRSLPTGVQAGSADVISTGECGDVLLMLDAPRLDSIDLAPEAIRQVLGALARTHSVFAGFPARLTSGLGLLPLGQWLTLDRPTSDSTPSVAGGWRCCAERFPEHWSGIDALLSRPAPFVEALRACQPTIVVGNAIPAELSAEPGRVTLHDWGLATRGPGALDLGLFVAAAYCYSPLTVAESVEVYRAERASAGRLPVDGDLWEREVALGLLAGFLRRGWSLSVAVNDLTEWQQIVADGCAAIG